MTHHESFTLLFSNTFTTMCYLFSKCRDDTLPGWAASSHHLSFSTSSGWATSPAGRFFVRYYGYVKLYSKQLSNIESANEEIRWDPWWWYIQTQQCSQTCAYHGSWCLTLTCETSHTCINLKGKARMAGYLPATSGCEQFSQFHKSHCGLP